MVHYDVKIHGLVQGVGFRYEAKKLADQTSLQGFVKNNADGSVELEVEGRVETVREFLNWCHKGPAYAKIEKVVITPSDIKNYKDFKILLE